MLLKLDSAGPLYEQIYRSMREEILAGRLRPGQLAPSTRELASANALSRNRVVLAYEQLLLEGYLVAHRGGGTFVAPELPEDLSLVRGAARQSARRKQRLPAPSLYAARLRDDVPRWTTRRSSQRHADAAPVRYDFRYGRLTEDEIPRRLWMELLSRRTKSAPAGYFDYGDPAGEPELREAIAQYARRVRGVACEADQIVVVSGSHQGIDLVARMLVDPGDRVIVEEAHYPGLRAIMLAAGARLDPVRVDQEGLDASLLKGAARLACVTPSHQYPLGGVMSLPRRLALLTWARKAGAYVLEDDYDSEFRYAGRPIESLQGLDQGERVIYAGSFSKLVFPALRLGYLVLPRSLVDSFVDAKAVADCGASIPMQLALCDFIREGHIDRHMRRLRISNAARHEALTNSIIRDLGDRAQIWGGNAGLHIALRLPGYSSRGIAELVQRARRADVGVYPLTPFFLNRPKVDGLLLGFAAMNRRMIQEGVRRLASAILDSESS